MDDPVEMVGDGLAHRFEHGVKGDEALAHHLTKSVFQNRVVLW